MNRLKERLPLAFFGLTECGSQVICLEWNRTRPDFHHDKALWHRLSQAVAGKWLLQRYTFQRSGSPAVSEHAHLRAAGSVAWAVLSELHEPRHDEIQDGAALSETVAPDAWEGRTSLQPGKGNPKLPLQSECACSGSLLPNSSWQFWCSGRPLSCGKLSHATLGQIHGVSTRYAGEHAANQNGHPTTPSAH